MSFPPHPQNPPDDWQVEPSGVCPPELPPDLPLPSPGLGDVLIVVGFYLILLGGMLLLVADLHPGN